MTFKARHDVDMTLKPDNRTICIVLWIAAMGATLYASVLPRLAPPEEYGIDKLIHFGVYGLLALLPTLAFRRQSARWTAYAVSFLLAVGIEIAQGYIPNRTASIHDVISSAFGMGAGVLAALVLLRRWERLRQPQNDMAGSGTLPAD